MATRTTSTTTTTAMSQRPDTIVNFNQKTHRKRKAQEPGAQEEQPTPKRRKQDDPTPPLNRTGSSSENVGNGLTINRAPSRARSAAPPSHDRSMPSRSTNLPSRNAQPEPELDDNQDITAMHSELDSVVGRERSDLSKASSSQVVPHFDLTKGKLPSKSFTASKPKSKVKPPSKFKVSKPPVLKDKSLESAKKALQDKVAKARRSSLGQRGKRTSDSFGNGQPVTPHSSVPSDRFYRHTDPALPDLARARHVLTWCASRSAPWPADSQTRLPPLSPANAALLASLQDQIVKQLADATIDIPLYSEKSKERPPAVENPQNERNRGAEGTLLVHEERCSHEDAAWSKLIQDYNTLQSQVLSGLQKASSSPGKEKGKEKEKLDLSDKWREVERELDEFSEAIENGTEREKHLNERCRNFPLQLESLKATLSKSNGFTHQARRHIDEMFATLDRQRGSRPGPSAPSAGPARSPRNLLKALARADEKKPGRRAVGGAAVVGGGMVTRSQQPERRVTAVGPDVGNATPRRVPGTPRRKGKGAR